MKKTSILWLLALILISKLAFGQGPSTNKVIEVAYDQDSLYHGAFKEYFADKINVRGNYEHGKRTGKWIFTISDSTKTVGYFKNGLQTGNWKYYLYDTLITEMNFKEGQFHGYCKVYHSPTQLNVEAIYIYGKLDSTYRSYYSNGQIKTHIEFSNGLRNGVFKHFKEDGCLITHHIYKNGNPINIIKNDILTDNKYYLGNLKDGTGTLVTLGYNERHDITSIRDYSLGKLDGKYVLYTEGQEVYTKGNFSNGYMIGSWTKISCENNVLTPIIKEFSIQDSITSDSVFYKTDINLTGSHTYKKRFQQFPQGDKALCYFLARSVYYPAIARENGYEGASYIHFVINEYGAFEDVEVMKSSSYSVLDEAALNAVKQMPHWEPRFLNNIPAKIRVTIPIQFQLR